MSLLHLPDEILQEIISYTSIKESDNYSEHEFSQQSLVSSLVILPGSFTSSTSESHTNLHDLVSFLSTCTRLRNLCGQLIFQHISLVRTSEIDALLAYPTRMDKWSDRKGLLRKFMREILQASFRRCSREELARLSFRPSVNGDRGFWSRYQRNFSANHYVTDLEVTNELLRNGEILVFENLKSLSVLDKPGTISPTENYGSLLPNLLCLCINLETLIGCEFLLESLPRLTGLLIICDINGLQPKESLSKLISSFGKTNNLHNFTFFVTDPDLLQYTEFLQLFQHILATGHIEIFNLRLTRKVGHREPLQKWEVLENPQKSGVHFVNALNSCPYLRSVMIDFDLLSNLQFPPHFHTPKEQKRQNLCFTLIDYSLSVPKLLFKPREIVANVIQSLGATEVLFIYGEVIDQSHLHAIGVMSNLLVCLASDPHRVSPYFGVQRVSMEKAWSMSDDQLVRHHYEDLIDKYEQSKKGTAQKSEIGKKIARAKLTDHHLFASPRYRRREEYEVVLQDCGGGCVMPLMLPVLENARSTIFWSYESSLRVLEHYCMREKALSSIWD